MSDDIFKEREISFCNESFFICVLFTWYCPTFKISGRLLNCDF